MQTTMHSRERWTVDTTTPLSVSLSRRVVTHHLSARTDRFLCVRGVVFTSTARRADARSRPSISPIDERACTSSSTGFVPTATVDRRRRRRHSTTREEEERPRDREGTRGNERRRGPSRDRIERIERIERIHRNPSKSIGRTVDDRSIESIAFIHSRVRSDSSIAFRRTTRDDDERCDDGPA